MLEVATDPTEANVLMSVGVEMVAPAEPFIFDTAPLPIRRDCGVRVDVMVPKPPMMPMVAAAPTANWQADTFISTALTPEPAGLANPKPVQVVARAAVVVVAVPCVCKLKPMPR